MSQLMQMPCEIILLFIQFLTVQDKLSLSMTCKFMHSLCEDDIFKARLEQNFPNKVTKFQSTISFKQRYQYELNNYNLILLSVRNPDNQCVISKIQVQLDDKDEDFFDILRIDKQSITLICDSNNNSLLSVARNYSNQFLLDRLYSIIARQNLPIYARVNWAIRLNQSLQIIVAIDKSIEEQLFSNGQIKKTIEFAAKTNHTEIIKKLITDKQASVISSLNTHLVSFFALAVFKNSIAVAKLLIDYLVVNLFSTNSNLNNKHLSHFMRIVLLGNMHHDDREADTMLIYYEITHRLEIFQYLIAAIKELNNNQEKSLSIKDLISLNKIYFISSLVKAVKRGEPAMLELLFELLDQYNNATGAAISVFFHKLPPPDKPTSTALNNTYTVSIEGNISTTGYFPKRISIGHPVIKEFLSKKSNKNGSFVLNQCL